MTKADPPSIPHYLPRVGVGVVLAGAGAELVDVRPRA